MALSCPFCGYVAFECDDTKLAADDVAYHVETIHPENDGEESPFLLRPTVSNNEPLSGTHRRTSRHRRDRDIHDQSSDQDGMGDKDEEYMDCDFGCGEKILHSELREHRALHESENAHLKERDHQRPMHESLSEDVGEISAVHKGLSNKMKPIGRNKKNPSGIFSKSRQRSKESSEASVAKAGQRLGKSELGPYAFEERMPSWLYRMLERGPTITWIDQIGSDGRTQRVERIANETSNLIPYLSRLCQRDKTVSKAWLCSVGVKHIFKVPREGGFCGYRNIQMMVSWMQHHQHPGHENFPGTTPNILYLQDLIESAWDNGFNASGRIETGGIRGTRKYIGTPEAQVLFQSLNIKCDTRAFSRPKGDKSDEPVHIRLLQFVMIYFSQGIQSPTDKVYETSLPPLYFQHPRHSMTIVGLEARKDGSFDLLVFDPMYHTASIMVRFMSTRSITFSPDHVLKAFRRGNDYLGKYNAFEVLSLGGLTKNDPGPS